MALPLVQISRLIADRRPAEALALLRDRPADEPEALFHRAQAHLLLREPHAAVARLERLASLRPDWPDLAETRAAALRRDARYEEAVAVSEDAPPTAQLLFERGVSLARLGEADASLAALDAALALDPEFAAAWVESHAPALERHGLDDALRRLSRAVACHGANGKYHAFACAYLLLSGRAAEAEAIYARHIDGQARRRPLVDGVRALLPHLAPGCRLFGLSASLLRHALAEAPDSGMVLEFGVRRGTSIRVLAGATAQDIHGFDSFEGLPESWGNERAGVLTTEAEQPAVPAHVHLHAGWFDDTLPAFLAAHAGPVRFVNVDSDIYSSARTVLTALTPRLRPGSVLVFDEMIGNRTWADDEFKAFGEFIAETGCRFEYFAIAPFTKQVAVRLVETPFK